MGILVYFDSAVATPSIKGKIITKNKVDASHILFEYAGKYNPEKHDSVPQRLIIGEATSDYSGKMLPDE